MTAILATKADSTDVNAALILKADASALSAYVTNTTEQTISGTKKFTANNNTFTRTLVLGAGTPINFIGMGNGTYNTGAFVCNTTDKFGVECPRESDSGSAAIVPFRIGARGGQLGILQAGDIYQNGNRVMDVGSAQTITGAKAFTGQVGNIQTEAGVYLGLDTNTTAPNANLAITSANTAAYIDMGPPNKDYGFRIIKWNNLNGDYSAQLVYGDDGSGQASAQIIIPRTSGTIALTSNVNTRLALDGSNTMTGMLNLKASGNSEGNIGPNGIRWNDTSLPQDTAPQYICTIDGFAVGGRQKWASLTDLKTQLGVPTNYVTTNTTQTISGAKTFSGSVTISGTLYIS